MLNSPLRYPGGKNILSAFIASLCVENNIKGHYVEPYAGGASVALFLIFNDYVEKVTINDKDRSIYAFWYSVLNRTEDLCWLIENTEISIENWHIQKTIQNNKNKENLLRLGFSTFFLNRTNRSGIITGGVIGGMDQNGEYKIDCRFNKLELIARIRKIARFKSRIKLFNLDAVDLLKLTMKEERKGNTLIYLDPPYFQKGSALYMNHYKSEDHSELSKVLRSIKSIKWVVSYDNIPEIKSLYLGFMQKEFSLNYNAYESRDGKEIMFFGPGVECSQLKNRNPKYFQRRKIKGGHKLIYKKDNHPLSDIENSYRMAST